MVASKTRNESPRKRYAFVVGLGFLATTLFAGSIYGSIKVMPSSGRVKTAKRNMRKLASYEDNTCHLKNDAAPEKVQPSITNCYMHSAMGCCAAAQDDTIAEAMGFLVPEVCADDDSPRPKAFDSLEEWFCLGCDPDADKYIDWYFPNRTMYDGAPGDVKETVSKTLADAVLAGAAATPPTPPKKSVFKMTTSLDKVPGFYGELRLCESFANKLMYRKPYKEHKHVRPDKSMLLDGFDGCALGLNVDYFSKWDNDYGGPEYEGTFPSQFWTDAAGDAPLAGFFPAELADSVNEEMLFFTYMAPPYYRLDNGFHISWHHADAETCFGTASGLRLAPVLLILLGMLVHALA